MASLGTIWAELGLKLTKFDQALRNAEAKIKQAEQKLEGLQKASKRLSDVGKKLTLGVTVPLIGIGVASTKMVMDFEQAMANAASVSGGTAKELEKMKEVAREMGKSTVFSAKEAADAMYYMASAGWKANQMTEAIKPTLDLAAATQSDLAFATDTVIATLNQFSLESKNTSRIANVFAAAIGNSQATLDKLSNSMRYVGPVANSLGYNVEETTAALMGLYNAGFKGEQAGTVLRAALSRLAEPSKESMEAINSLRLSFEQINPETHSLAEIVGLLAQKGIDTATAIKLFGQEAGPGMLSLIKQGKDALIEYEASITGTNAATEMAEKQLDTLKGQLKRLWSAVSEVAIQIGDILTPIIENLVNKYIMPAVQWFSNLDDSTKRIIVTVGMFAAAIGPVLFVMGKLGGTIVTLSQAKAVLADSIITKKLIPAITNAGKALWSLQVAGGPVLWVIEALIAVVAAFAYAWHRDWGGIREKTRATVELIVTWFTIMGNSISEVWNKVKQTVYQKLADLIAAIEPFLRWLPESWRNALESLRQTVQEKADAAGENLMALAAKSEELSARMEAAKDRVSRAFSSWESTVKKTTDRVQEAEEKTKEKTNTASNIMNNALSSIGEGFNRLSERAKTASKQIQDALSAAMDRINLKTQILQAQFELLKAKMGENADESKVLKAELEMLNAQYALQDQKVATLTKAYEQMKAAKGENAEETQKLYLKLLQEQKALQDLYNEIEKAKTAYKEAAQAKYEFSVADGKVTVKRGNVSFTYDRSKAKKREQEEFEEHRDEIADIARRQGVDMGVAHDMWKQNRIDKMMGKVAKYATGGMITRPVLMMDLLTGKPAGVAGEAGSEAIVPLRSKGYEIDYNKLSQAVENGTYRAVKDAITEPTVGNKPQEIVLMMDGTRLARLLLPKLRAEQQRLGVETT